MKSIFSASRFCAFVVVAFCSGLLSASEPTWIFNNGAAGERAAVGQGRAISEFGLYALISTGSDMTLTVPMAEEDAFDAAERPFFALRYKASTQQKIGGLFFTNDGDLPNLSDKSFTSFPISGDDQWREVVVDMREGKPGAWKGKIRSFRLDPTNPSDSETKVAISRMGFFKTTEDAQAFLNAANDKPNYDMATEVANQFGRCFIPAGAIKSEFNRDDYLIKNSPGDFVAVKRLPREVFLVARKNGNRLELEPFCDVSSKGFATYCAVKPGERAITKVPFAEQLAVDTSPAADAIRFVVARGIMTLANRSEFQPEKKLDGAEKEALAKKLESFEEYGEQGQKLVDLAKRFQDDEEFDRGTAATLIMNAMRDALGTSVASPYPKEYFTRERIRIGAWGNFRVGDYDEEYMRTYADCGFDFLLNLAVPSTNVLKDADKYGVEVYVNDGAYRNPDGGDKEYCDHPSYTGCFVVDEPGSDDYDKLAALCNPYFEKTGKTAYVNLLPMYANAAQLKYGAGAAAIEYYDSDPDLFRKYCASFCDKIKGDYICTDIYPLNWVDGKKTTYDEYAESINIIASVAREYDREFWCYIQTFAWIPSKRTPTEAEYRWQCWSMLSFGCRCILCWTYAGYKPGFPSLVDVDSSKSPAWYDARPVFWELRRLSDEYVKYRNLGAFAHNCSDATPYLKFSNEYKDFSAIQEIECADPLLVGCFEKKEDASARAFTLVNMVDLQENRGTTVRMKLDAEQATLWQRGVPTVVQPDEEGWFQFHLSTGEGVFVALD